MPSCSARMISVPLRNTHVDTVDRARHKFNGRRGLPTCCRGHGHEVFTPRTQLMRLDRIGRRRQCACRLELTAEEVERLRVGRCCRIAKRAEGTAEDLGAQLVESREVFGLARTGLEVVQQLVDPPRAFPARRALPQDSCL